MLDLYIKHFEKKYLTFWNNLQNVKDNSHINIWNIRKMKIVDQSVLYKDRVLFSKGFGSLMTW